MTSVLPKAVAGLTAGIALYLFFFPPDALTPQAARAAALGVAMLGLLASAIVPEFVTALLFFLFAMLLGAAPADVIFSGFHSAALWMVFAGLIIAVAVRLTGLGERIAQFIAPKFGASYIGIISGVVFVSVGLAFVMPATMGRVLLLAPIVLAIADSYGFGEGSRGRTGMVLALAYGTFLVPMSILPANVPNIVLVGAAETLYGIVPEYGSYLLLHFPVLGLLRSFVIIAVIVFLFPDKPSKSEGSKAGSAGADEYRLALMLAVALVLWVTDFIHHISPVWIALAVAALCMIPGIGVVSSRTFAEKVDVSPFIYVDGIMGLGALVADSGLAHTLGSWLIGVAEFEPGNDTWTFFVMTVVGTLIGPLVTNPGIPVVMAPLAGSIADAAGLPVATVLMMIVIGFSMVILPFQAAPLVVAAQICGVRIRDSIKTSLVLLVVTLIAVMPVNYLWWRFLGYLH